MPVTAGNRLKISYVSSHEPRNKSAWSGSHYSIYTSVTKHIGDVEILGPFEPSFALFIGKIKHFIARIFGKRYNFRHSKSVSKAYGRYFSGKLLNAGYDLIIAPSASCEVAYLETGIPIIYIADATFKSSHNYHKALSDLSVSSEKETFATEKRALEKSSVLAF